MRNKLNGRISDAHHAVSRRRSHAGRVRTAVGGDWAAIGGARAGLVPEGQPYHQTMRDRWDESVGEHHHYGTPAPTFSQFQASHSQAGLVPAGQPYHQTLEDRYHEAVGELRHYGHPVPTFEAWAQAHGASVAGSAHGRAWGGATGLVPAGQPYYQTLEDRYHEAVGELRHYGHPVPTFQAWAQAHGAQAGLVPAGQPFHQTLRDRYDESVGLHRYYGTPAPTFQQFAQAHGASVAGMHKSRAGLVPAGQPYHQTAQDRYRESEGMRRRMGDAPISLAKFKARIRRRAGR